MKKIVSGVLTLIIAFSANAQSKKTPSRNDNQSKREVFIMLYESNP